MPDYAERIHEAFEPINQRIEKVQKSAGSITASPRLSDHQEVTTVVRVADQPAPAWPSYLIRGVGSVWGAVIVGGIVPFLMFFMLARKSHLYDWMAQHIWRNCGCAEFHVDAGKNGARICRRKLDRRRAMAAMMVGVLYALKVPGAVPLGIASGFLNLVPFLGAILAAGLPLFASIFQFDSPAPFLLIGCRGRRTAYRVGQFFGAEIHRLARQYRSRRGDDGDAVLGLAVGNHGRAAGRAPDGVCEARRGLPPFAVPHLASARGKAARRTALGSGQRRTRRSRGAILRQTSAHRRKRLIREGDLHPFSRDICRL